jgi:membrane protein
VTQEITEAAGEHTHARSERVDRVRARYQRSLVRQVLARLNEIDGLNQAMLLGANVVLTILPLMVLLSSFASRRADDDIALHMGLDERAATIVRHLFAAQKPKLGLAVIIAFVFLGFWTLGVVASLQNLYERAYDLDHRGFRDAHRFVAWMVGFCTVIVLVGASVRPVMHVTAAPVLVELINFALITPFVWWTMHFLLNGRVDWHDLVPPAIATGIGMVGLGVFSKLYFSSTIISDSKLYGSIGAVFSLVTWVIAVASVLVVGTVFGAEWQARRVARAAGVSAPPAHP